MALSHALTEGGHPPEQLRVSAAVTAVLGADGLKVARSHLSVRTSIPGLDASELPEWTRKGDEGCPVSNALRGNVEITIDAVLE
jgi:osmotically inducible protein OsmC